MANNCILKDIACYTSKDKTLWRYRHFSKTCHDIQTGKSWVFHLIKISADVKHNIKTPRKIAYLIDGLPICLRALLKPKSSSYQCGHYVRHIVCEYSQHVHIIFLSHIFMVLFTLICYWFLSKKKKKKEFPPRG